ncbi:hypothetical protein DFR52_101963 [Hoeflea marina]|uniref:Uncharacterized protein n=1 Tax=Hoeflea marina TaxID=274592 RepID=A0A317PS31_9HYPH|nr:hypothetical protein [Hoeflea marina]PWW04268.1 hypothetical protein DFR52_101963 [Hoeflea marina]
MTSSRLFTAAMMLFWIATSALIALMCTWAPRGGMSLFGLSAFAGSPVIESFDAALVAIGLSARGAHFVYTLIAATNVIAAGLLIFAMMFMLLGLEQEQREARPMVEGAAAASALTALVVMAISLAGGHAGPLMALQLVVLAGHLATLRSLADVPLVTDASRAADAELADIVARHAESHAAFSAQTASISRSEPRP